VRGLAALAGAALLGACAQLAAPAVDEIARPPRETLDRFVLEGRLAVRGPDEGFSARVSWRHEPANDDITLSSPLGQAVARLRADPAGARLTTADHGSFEAENLEALSRQVFGQDLPLSAMPRWALGRTGSAAASVERDELLRLTRQSDAGWLIEYPEYESMRADALPRRIRMGNGEVDLKLAIDRWEIPE
jgi:outer membrane lipoprotein LolB